MKISGISMNSIRKSRAGCLQIVFSPPNFKMTTNFQYFLLKNDSIHDYFLGIGGGTNGYHWVPFLVFPLANRLSASYICIYICFAQIWIQILCLRNHRAVWKQRSRRRKENETMSLVHRSFSILHLCLRLRIISCPSRTRNLSVSLILPDCPNRNGYFAYLLDVQIIRKLLYIRFLSA